MVFNPKIDNKTRFLVLYLDAEMKPTRISKTIGVPIRTVQDWVDKTEEGKDIRKVGKGRGRKSTKTSTFKKKVLRQARMTPAKASTRNLAARNRVTKTAIHDIYVEKGLKYRNTETLPELTDTQMHKRINSILFRYDKG